MQTITFIGNGNMALSIAKGLKDKYKIEVVGRALKKLETFEEALGVSIEKHLLSEFDLSNKTIILCVKPYNIKEVSQQCKNYPYLLISVLAGTPLASLKTSFQATFTIRSMPNLCASVNESMTTITGDIEAKETVIPLLKSIGQTLWVESEKALDIATALAGSGPAYLALIAEAFTDGAVKQGLTREEAMVVMRGLFKGFGELIQHQHPALIKDGVMSPAGTTAQGYSALEEGGVRFSCINAIEKAYQKTCT